MTKITKKKFLKAVEGSGGIQSTIAQKLVVSRSAITQHLEKNPELNKLLKQEKNKIIDLAESKLFKAVIEGEKWAILRVLETLGKERGYGKEVPVETEKEEDKKLILEVINIHKKEDE